MNAPITGDGFRNGGIFWHRRGAGTDELRYVGDTYQAGGSPAYAGSGALVIEPLDSIVRGARRLFEVRLFGRVVATKPSLRAAKKVGENHLRLELDISFRCLASLCRRGT